MQRGVSGIESQRYRDDQLIIKKRKQASLVLIKKSLSNLIESKLLRFGFERVSSYSSKNQAVSKLRKIYSRLYQNDRKSSLKLSFTKWHQSVTQANLILTKRGPRTETLPSSVLKCFLAWRRAYQQRQDQKIVSKRSVRKIVDWIERSFGMKQKANAFLLWKGKMNRYYKKLIKL